MHHREHTKFNKRDLMLGTSLSRVDDLAGFTLLRQLDKCLMVFDELIVLRNRREAL